MDNFETVISKDGEKSKASLPSFKDLKKQVNSIPLVGGVDSTAFSSNSEESKYGEDITPFTDLNEVRGERQGLLEKYKNGALRMAGTATTSFLEGTVGLLVGTTEALATGDSTKLFNNEFGQALDSMNESLAEAAPIYYTKEQQDSILNANFIPDKLFNGAGYMLGAIGSGYAGGKLLGSIAKLALVNKPIAATATAESIINSAKGTRLATGLQETLVGAMSAHGESAAEARGARKDTYEKLVTKYQEDFGTVPEGQHLEEINRLADAAGNVDYLTNLVVTGGTNMLQFGKLMTGGYKAESKEFWKIVRDRAGKYTTPEPGSVGKLARKVSPYTSGMGQEALQEGVQYMTQIGTTDYYTRQFNKEGWDSISESINSVKDAFIGTINSKEGFESMLLGAILGAGGGLLHNDIKSKTESTNKALSILNDTKLENIKKKLGSSVAIQSYEQDKAIALQNKDIFQYKNLEYDQFKTWVKSRIDTNQYNSLIEELDEQKTLTEEQFKEKFGFPKDEALPKPIHQLVEELKIKAKAIKELSESIDSKFPINNTNGVLSNEEFGITKALLFHTATSLDNTNKRIKEVANKITMLSTINNAIEVFDSVRAASQEDYLGNYVSRVNATIEERRTINPMSEDIANLESFRDDIVRLEGQRQAFIRQYNKLVTPESAKQVVDEVKAETIKPEVVPEEIKPEVTKTPEDVVIPETKVDKDVVGNTNIRTEGKSNVADIQVGEEFKVTSKAGKDYWFKRDEEGTIMVVSNSNDSQEDLEKHSQIGAVLRKASENGDNVEVELGKFNDSKKEVKEESKVTKIVEEQLNIQDVEDSFDESIEAGYTLDKVAQALREQLEAQADIKPSNIRMLNYMDKFSGSTKDLFFKVITSNDSEYNKYLDPAEIDYVKANPDEVGVRFILTRRESNGSYSEVKATQEGIESADGKFLAISPLLNEYLSEDKLGKDNTLAISPNHFLRVKGVKDWELGIEHPQWSTLWQVEVARKNEFRAKLESGKISYIPIKEKSPGKLDNKGASYISPAQALFEDINKTTEGLTPRYFIPTTEEYNKETGEFEKYQVVDRKTGTVGEFEFLGNETRKLRIGSLYAIKNGVFYPLTSRKLKSFEVETVTNLFAKLEKDPKPELRESIISNYVQLTDSKKAVNKNTLFYNSKDKTIHFGNSVIPVNEATTSKEFKEFLTNRRRQVDTLLLKSNRSIPKVNEKGDIDSKNTQTYYEFLFGGNSPAFTLKMKPLGERQITNSYFIFDSSKAIEGEPIKLDDTITTKEVQPTEGIITEAETTEIKEIVEKKIEDKPKLDEKPDIGEKKGRGFKDIPLDRTKDNTNKNYKLENTKKAEQWFKDRFKGNSDFKLTKELIDGKAFGQFYKGIVYLYEKAEEGTIYHEAFHKVSFQYLTEAQRHQLYDEYKAAVKDWNLTDLQVEERLAEDFRVFILTGQKAILGKPVRNTLFRRLYNYIKSLLTADVTIEQIYLQLASKDGYSKYKVLDSPDVKLDRKFLGFSETHTKEWNDTITGLLFDTLFNHGLTPAQLVESKNRVELIAIAYDIVHDTLIEKYKEEVGNTNKAQDIFLIKNNYPAFIEQHKNSINALINLNDAAIKEVIEYEEDLEEGIEETENRENTKGEYQASNEVPTVTTTSNNTKMLLATLKKRNSDRSVVKNTLGEDKIVDFNEMYKFLLRNLHGLDTMSQMYDKLEDIKSIEPSVQSLIDRLGMPSKLVEEVDGKLKTVNFHQAKVWTDFWQDFHKSESRGTITLINPETGNIYQDDANRDRLENRIKEQWKSNLYNSKYLIKSGTVAKIDESIMKDFPDVLDLLEELGVTIDSISKEQIYEEVSNTDISNIRKFFKTKFDEGSDISTLDELFKDTAFKKILELAVTNSKLMVELSYLNAEGKTIYAITLNNYFSLMSNALNNSKTWDELISKYPQFNSVSCEGSVWLDELFPKDKDGNRGKRSKLKFEVTTIAGIKIDGDNESGTVITKADVETKFIQEFNDLFQTGKSSVPRTADKATDQSGGIKKDRKNALVVKLEDIKKDGFNTTRVKEVFEGYFLAELKRIQKFNVEGLGKNIDIYNKKAGNWTIFEDILSENTKKELLKKDNTEELQELEKEFKNLTNQRTKISGINEESFAKALEQVASDSNFYKPLRSNLSSGIKQDIINGEQTSLMWSDGLPTDLESKLRNQFKKDSEDIESESDRYNTWFDTGDILYSHDSESNTYSMQIEGASTTISKKDYYEALDKYKEAIQKAEDLYVTEELNRIKDSYEHPYLQDRIVRLFDNSFVLVTNHEVKEDSGKFVNSLDFVYLDEFNYDRYNKLKKGKDLGWLDSSEIPTPEILKAVNKDVVEFLEQQSVGTSKYQDKGVLSNLDLMYEFGLIDSKGKSLGINKELTNMSSVEDLARTFTVNHLIQTIEHYKVIFGDKALYKDAFKRHSGGAGTKKFCNNDKQLNDLINSNKSVDEHGFEYDVEKNFKVVIIADVKVKSEAIDTYIHVAETRMKDSGIAEEVAKTLAENQMDEYNKMTEADAQALTNPVFHRHMKIKTSTWNFSTQEKQYQYEMAYMYVKLHERALVDSKYSKYELSEEKLAKYKELSKVNPEGIINIEKGQYFGAQEYEGLNATTFHKLSYAPMTWRLVEGTNLEDKLLSMLESQTAYMVFESGVKLGSVTNEDDSKPSFYDSEGNVNIIDSNTVKQTLPWDYLGIQVELQPKAKEKVIFGTQFRKLFESNLFDSGVIAIPELEELHTEYLSIIKSLVDSEWNKLIKDLGVELDEDKTLKSMDVTKLVELLKKDAVDKQLADNLVDSLKINSETKELVYPIDSLVNRPKLESLMMSLISSRVTRQKMSGDSLVQLANTGWETKGKRVVESSNELLSYRIDPVTGKTLPMQVKVPMNAQYKELLKVYKTVEGINQAIKNNLIDKSILTMVGYRIPTQGLNSIEFMEIVGFISDTHGASIILPSEIVAKSGGDFDIDKLNIFRPNFRINGLASFINSELVRIGKASGITYKVYTESQIDDILGSEEDSDIVNLVKSIEPRFKGTTIKYIKNNSKKGKQNRIIEISKSILEHPYMFEQLVTPNTTRDMDATVNAIRYAEYLSTKPKEVLSKDEFLKQLKETTVSNTQELMVGHIMNQFRDFLGGKNAVGLDAIHITAHVLFQQAGTKVEASKMEINLDSHLEEDYYLFGKRFNKNGKLISDIQSQIANLHLDAAKDPKYKDINLTKELLPTAHFLNHIGVAEDTIIYFIKQPVILELLKAEKKTLLDRLKKDEGFKPKPEDVLRTKYAKLAGIKTNKDGTIESYDKAAIGKTEEDKQLLLDNIAGNIDNKLQLQVLEDFLNYREYAKALGVFMKAINYDTTKFKDLAALRERKNAVKQLGTISLTTDSSISWFNKFWSYVNSGYYQQFVKDLQKDKSEYEVEQINRKIRSVYVEQLSKDFPELGKIGLSEDSSTIKIGNTEVLKALEPTFNRLMVGNHGVYIEFNEPKDKGKFVKQRLQYKEYNKNSKKLYSQEKTVNYADYKVGKWYVDLYESFNKQSPDYNKVVSKELSSDTNMVYSNKGLFNIGHYNDIMNKTIVGSFNKVDETYNMFSHLFITETKEFIKVKNKIVEEVNPKGKLAERLPNMIDNDFINYITQKFGTYKKEALFEHINRLFYGDNSLAKQLKGIKDIVGDNVLLNQLQGLIDSLGNNPDNISIYTRKLSKNESDVLTGTYRELSEYDGENLDKVQSFMEDLTTFGILQSGLHNSPITFLGLIPNEYYGDITKSAIDFYKKLDSNRIKDLHKDFFVRWFIKNINNTQIVPNYKLNANKSDLDYSVKYRLFTQKSGEYKGKDSSGNSVFENYESVQLFYKGKLFTIPNVEFKKHGHRLQNFYLQDNDDYLDLYSDGKPTNYPDDIFYTNGGKSNSSSLDIFGNPKRPSIFEAKNDKFANFDYSDKAARARLKEKGLTDKQVEDILETQKKYLDYSFEEEAQELTGKSNGIAEGIIRIYKAVNNKYSDYVIELPTYEELIYEFNRGRDLGEYKNLKDYEQSVLDKLAKAVIGIPKRSKLTPEIESKIKEQVDRGKSVEQIALVNTYGLSPTELKDVVDRLKSNEELTKDSNSELNNLERIKKVYPEKIEDISSDYLVKVSQIEEKGSLVSLGNIKNYGKAAEQLSELYESEISLEEAEILKGNTESQKLVELFSSDERGDGVILKQFAQKLLEDNTKLVDRNQLLLFPTKEEIEDFMKYCKSK